MAFAYPVAMPADFTERVLRGLYSAALYLLLPITLYHLIWRSFRQGEYLQRWKYSRWRKPRQIRWYTVTGSNRYNAAEYRPRSRRSIGLVGIGGRIADAVRRTPGRTGHASRLDRPTG